MPTSRLIFAAVFLLALLPLAASPTVAGETITVSRSDIAAYKEALKLSAMQQVYWIPVAAALKTLPAEGKTFVVDAQTFQRLMPVLRPLFNSLDDDQKQVAMGLAQRLGLMQFASLI